MLAEPPYLHQSFLAPRCIYCIIACHTYLSVILIDVYCTLYTCSTDCDSGFSSVKTHARSLAALEISGTWFARGRLLPCSILFRVVSSSTVEYSSLLCNPRALLGATLHFSLHLSRDQWLVYSMCSDSFGFLGSFASTLKVLVSMQAIFIHPCHLLLIQFWPGS